MSPEELAPFLETLEELAARAQAAAQRAELAAEDAAEVAALMRARIADRRRS